MKNIADHIFDIIENSINASADEVQVKIAFLENHFYCYISDNGIGISGQEVLDPFVTSRKTRRIGLGLPLLKKAAEDTGGYLKISKSKNTRGTDLEFEMDMSHIDAKPFGDLARIFSDIFFAWTDINFKFYIIDESREKLILNFQDLRDEISKGSTDFLDVRKHIYKISRKELEKINIEFIQDN